MNNLPHISGMEEAKPIEVAAEVKEPPPPDITQLCQDTFQKTSEYLRGELAGI